MEDLQILAPPPKRANLVRETIFALAIFLLCFIAFALVLRSMYVAFIVAILISVYLQWIDLKARSRWVWYDGTSREIVVEWRITIQGARRDVYPLNRFSTVISYYSWGQHARNCVCILDRVSGDGLQLASFDLYYKYRSFWDLFPPIVEAVEAEMLRERLRKILQIEDLGFVGMRSHPRTIKK